MAEMANNRQIVKNILNKMAKGPFGKCRFGENGRNGEQSPMQIVNNVLSNMPKASF